MPTPLVLIDAFAYIGGHDFTTDSNRLMWSGEAAVKERTTFGSAGWTECSAGLKSHSFDYAGFWQSAAADAVDPIAFADLGIADRVYTFGPVETEGQVAYMMQAGAFNYSLLGEVGEMAPFAITAAGTNSVGVVRGQLAKAIGAVSATGALGSVVQLTTVSATQYLYATLHVFGTPGTTITVQIQSDDNLGMSSPTTRATIGPITTGGGTWMTRVAGPIATDTYWRMNVSAITGTFTVAGAIGVQ